MSNLRFLSHEARSPKAFGQIDASTDEIVEHRGVLCKTKIFSAFKQGDVTIHKYANILFNRGSESEYYYRALDVIQFDSDVIKYVFLCAIVVETETYEKVIMPLFVSTPDFFFSGQHDSLNVLVLEATMCTLSSVIHCNSSRAFRRFIYAFF